MHDDDMLPRTSSRWRFRIPESLEDRARFAIVLIAAYESYRLIREILHDVLNLVTWPGYIFHWLVTTLTG